MTLADQLSEAQQAKLRAMTTAKPKQEEPAKTRTYITHEQMTDAQYRRFHQAVEPEGGRGRNWHRDQRLERIEER